MAPDAPSGTFTVSAFSSVPVNENSPVFVINPATPSVREYRKPLTFRSSKIIYYGPHPCENCGVTIAKMGHQFGGTAFTYPEGPIYPNTEWQPHVCDPSLAGTYTPGAVSPPAV